MQDTEFTVEEGSSTCSRRATPSGPRRPRCASRSTRSTRGCSRARRRSRRSTPASLDALLHPTFDPDGGVRGARDAASPRRRAPPRARSCSPPTRRSRRREQGRDVILVRPFTEADDVAGFHAAQGHPHLARAARRRTRRWSRAGWAGRRWPAPASWRSTSRARGARRRTRAPRGRPDRDRRHHRHA